MLFLRSQLILYDLSNNKTRYKPKLAVKAKQQKAYFSPNWIMLSPSAEGTESFLYTFFFFAESLFFSSWLQSQKLNTVE